MLVFVSSGRLRGLRQRRRPHRHRDRPDGALWFTQSNGGNPRDGNSYFQASVGRITSSGAYSSYPVPASARSVPGLDAITVGPNGNLWFTETAVDRIGEITPRAASPAIHEFSLPAGDRLAQGVGSSITSADTIAIGPGNDIWFTEQGSNAIGVMSTSGTLLEKFTVPDSNQNPTPLGITKGTDDTMWFTETTANQVASITAGGTITLHPLPTAADGPESIVYGPDGNLCFTEDTGVASIDPGTEQDHSLPSAHLQPGPGGDHRRPRLHLDLVHRAQRRPPRAGCPDPQHDRLQAALRPNRENHRTKAFRSHAGTTARYKAAILQAKYSSHRLGR